MGEKMRRAGLIGWDAALAMALLAAIAGMALGGLLGGGRAERGVSGVNVSWVIPPGREAAALELARTIAREIPSSTVAGVSLEGGELRVTLEPSGGFVVTTTDGRALDVRGPNLEAAARRYYRGDLWEQPSAPPGIAPPAAGNDEHSSNAWSGQWGMTTPAVMWARRIVAVGPAQFMIAWFVLVLVLIALAIRLSREPEDSATDLATDPSRWQLFVVAALLIACACALRVHAAATVPLETDEYRVYTEHAQVFDGDHDAWLHPPLFRAAQLQWVSWTSAEGSLGFRALGCVFGALAAGLLLIAIVRRSPRWLSLVAWLPVGIGAGIVHDSMLARPYAFASCLFAVVILLLLARRRGRLHIAGALAACCLLLWTDVVAGAIGVLTLSIVLGFEWGVRSRAFAAAAAVLVIAALPVLPGALQAAAEPTLPGHDDSGQVALGQEPGRGMGDGSSVGTALATLSLTAFGVASNSRSWGVLGALVIIVLLVFGLRDRRTRPWAVALLAAIALSLVIGGMRAVRPRNVLLLASLLAIVASDVLPKLPAALRSAWPVRE